MAASLGLHAAQGFAVVLSIIWWWNAHVLTDWHGVRPVWLPLIPTRKGQAADVTASTPTGS